MSNTRSPSASDQSRTTSRSVSKTILGSMPASSPSLPVHVSVRTSRGQATSPLCDQLESSRHRSITFRDRLCAIPAVRVARGGLLPVPDLLVRRPRDLQVPRPAHRPVRRSARVLPRAHTPLLGGPAETWREVAVIFGFHLVGLGLELFKVRIGSWQYPGDAVTKIGGVPLFAGFMYAAVGSYICQAWRRFDLRVSGYRMPLALSFALIGFFPVAGR